MCPGKYLWMAWPRKRNYERPKNFSLVIRLLSSNALRKLAYSLNHESPIAASCQVLLYNRQPAPCSIDSWKVLLLSPFKLCSVALPPCMCHILVRYINNNYHAFKYCKWYIWLLLYLVQLYETRRRVVLLWNILLCKDTFYCNVQIL